jgi:hypothetical protein
MFSKNFARMVSREQLSDEEVELFFDIVQSVVPTKLMIAYDTDNEEVEVEVISFTDSDRKGDLYVYEIILQDEIDADEGDQISLELFEEFDDITFTFEASVEV